MGHHPVIREDKKFTSLRVVFDGSMKIKEKRSVNDYLYNGAVVQNSLFEILILFRSYKFVVLSDIKQMYRMILINPEHLPLQNILWRESPNSDIQCLQLQTVTYGLKSSSFLATRCLVHLANTEGTQFPLASSALLKNTYVDDILAGADTLQDAKELKSQLIQLLKSGSFELHKWCSNELSILDDIPKEKCHLDEIDMNKTDCVVKTLGLSYIPTSDHFKITSPKGDINSCLTKRQILSYISKFYDPLGLVGPLLVSAKLFMQKLWSLQLKWDEILPDDLLESWKSFLFNLSSMAPIFIPRNMIFSNANSIHLVGYCDSSTVAYGAVCYLCSISENDVHVNIMCSKSRIVPLNKNLTIPRLELNSALLLSNLAKSVYNLFELKIDKIVLYSDSKIALAWIHTDPIKLNAYDANRVLKIQNLTSNFEWQYINSKSNPADCLSRGLEPHEMCENLLWFNGPQNLLDKDFSYHDQPIVFPSPLPEEKKIILVTKQEAPPLFFEKYSNITKLQRIIAYLFRFINNAKTKNKNTENLTS